MRYVHHRTGLSPSLVSQSGRTLLVSVFGPGDAWTPQLLDSATFQIIDSWDDTRFASGHFLYSDGLILAEIQKQQQWFVREIRKSWKPFSQQVDEPHPTKFAPYGFLNNETLASVCGDELLIQTVDGLKLFRQSIPEHGLFFHAWPTTATSAGGERFAVILDRMRGINNPNLDLYSFRANDRVVVFSIPRRGAIFSVKLIGSSPWFSHYLWNSIALSPDGLLLGIVSSEGVRVYAVPPIQPGS